MFWTLIGAGVFTYGLFYSIILFFIDCDLKLAFCERFGKSPAHLKGKVVFITGASSGIGEALAVSLAKHGVKLVLTARRRDELDRVKRNCLEASKGLLQDKDILIIQMDMCDVVSHKKHFDHAIRYFNGVDILVNNAGRSQRAIWENIELSVDKDMFELNVFSVINLSRVALQHFNQRGSGHIAVTSSMAGLFGVPFSGSYTASKHAIHGYMNSLKNEKIGRQLSVTLFCPGPTFTNFLQESYTDKLGEKYGVSVQPSDKRMTAERCGDLCAIALANKTSEAWMAIFPLIPITYLAVYFPIIFNFALKVVGVEKLFKFRDSQETNPLTEEIS